MKIVQANFTFDKTVKDPDALLDRYFTLTGWSEAMLAAGAGAAAVVQRFHRNARTIRNGVEYIFCEGPIAPAVAALEPDVAHVNGLVFPGETWRLRRGLPASTAIVVQSHSDGGAIGRAPILRLVGRAVRGAADAFLFAAAEHADEWRRAGFISPRQPTYCVMPASTTFRPVPRAAARQETLIGGSPAVLWVGRLNANKDPLAVLDGFDRSLAELPGARLTMIYSADDLLPAVRERLRASPALAEHVRLVGGAAHDRMPSFFSAADLFVVGSHHEGSGYSLMEACACGAIPVVTDIPTFRLLTGGAAGALWAPGDGAAFARALVEVSRRDLGTERARLATHVERQLSWSAIGQRAMEVYGEVVQRRRS
jgi:glycosyltransferase involved in cell wall biosynthesis